MKGRFCIRIFLLLVACLFAQNGEWTLAQKITSYPYEMSPEQRAEFLSAFKSVKEGDTYEQVISKLGPPYDEFTLQAKGINIPVRGTGVDYHLKKIGRGGNEKKDEYLVLEFDNDKKLVGAGTNTSGLFVPFDLTILESVSTEEGTTFAKRIYKEGKEVK